MAGPVGNINSATHGRRSKRLGLVIVRMARKYRSIETNISTFRRELEAEARQLYSIQGPLPTAHSSISLAPSAAALAISSCF